MLIIRNISILPEKSLVIHTKIWMTFFSHSQKFWDIPTGFWVARFPGYHGISRMGYPNGPDWVVHYCARLTDKNSPFRDQDFCPRREHLPWPHRRHGTGFQLTLNHPVIPDHSKNS